jgi:tetratricopeptide (TPR) repeat protein
MFSFIWLNGLPNRATRLITIAYVKQAQELFRRVNDPPGGGHVNEVLGVAHHTAGANNRALKCFKKALRIKRNVCERVGEGYVLARQSAVESALGDSSMAIKHANQALDILRKIGDRRGEALALNHIGTAYRLFGNTKQAIEYYTDAMEIARGLGLRAEEGHALFGRALATDVGVCREKAIFDAKAALIIFEGLGTHQAASVRTQLEQWKHTP